MKVRFESVVDGINRYIDKEIYGGLNDLQEMLARIAVGRINQNSSVIKQYLMTNGFAKTLGLVDNEGMVEIDEILGDLRKEIERKGTVEANIPLIGKLKFTATDVDVLKNEILRG